MTCSQMKLNITAVLITIGLPMLSGCVSGGPSSSEGTVLGSWGGPRAVLSLSADSGTINYDCAHGSLTAPVRTDHTGRFEVAGFHVREHGGPIRVDEVLDAVPARYVGHVRGDRMELRVFAGPDTIGPLTLTRGATSQLVRCL